MSLTLVTYAQSVKLILAQNRAMSVPLKFSEYFRLYREDSNPDHTGPIPAPL